MLRSALFLISALTLCGAVTARATLTFELRLVGGGKTVNSLSVNQTVNMELYAVVTGAAGNSAQEGFQSGYVSILSDNTGNVRGNLTGTLVNTFAAANSQPGLSVDLDGDGDKDLGSNGTNSDTSFIRALAASMQTTTGTTITDGREFKLEDITFTVTQILNPLSPTPIHVYVRVTNFTSPIGVEAVWQEDNQTSSMTLTPGGTFPNSFPIASTDDVRLKAIPEPSGALLLSGAVALAWRRRLRAGRI